MKNAPQKLIIHHTADSTNLPQFKKVNRYHREKFSFESSLGYFCGYHYFIERDGSVVQARKDSDEGAHTIGQNLVSIGIGLAGNFDFELPSAAQKEAMATLCVDLMKKHRIPITQIVPHRMFQIKDCPGNLLQDQWAQYAVLEHELNLLAKLVLWLKIQGILK